MWLPRAPAGPLAVLLGMAAGVLPACSRGRPASRPAADAPVVIVSIDTLRADRLPAYGYGGVETPHIDALRRDAVLFESAWSHCPLTLPSHVSMLTGLLPADHGVRDNIGYAFVDKTRPRLAAVLQARGYATGAVVSAYVLRAATGLREGFAFYDEVSAAPREGAAMGEAQRPAHESLQAALGWLETVRARPFFLFLHLYEPHTPYDPPEPFRTRARSPPPMPLSVS
jgi:choline-sulfatase